MMQHISKMVRKNMGSKADVWQCGRAVSHAQRLPSEKEMSVAGVPVHHLLGMVCSIVCNSDVIKVSTHGGKLITTRLQSNEKYCEKVG